MAIKKPIVIVYRSSKLSISELCKYQGFIKIDNKKYYLYWKFPGRACIRTFKEIKPICMNKFNIRPPY